MSLPVTTATKVRLKTDLTHYHPDLIQGTEGYTIGVYGQSSRLSKRYIGVWFPGIRIVDVDWAALEIVDEQQRARLEQEGQEKQKSASLARNVLKRMGL